MINNYKEGIMKKIFLVLLVVLFITTSSTVFAAEKVPLGMGNLAVKTDWIKFTDLPRANSAFYIGLEGYGAIAENWYLGMESGYAKPQGTIMGYDRKMTYVPIELNIKYAALVAQNVALDIGGGVSYTYNKWVWSGSTLPETRDDKWLFGGQFFADLNFTYNQFFAGISGKYQITQEYKRFDYNANNLRLGGQIGIMF